MVLSKRAKDIHRCLRNIDSFSNCQASVLDWDSDTLRWMKICLAPVDGPYKGGKFEFEVRFEKHYPKTSPGVSCLTPIYHPNIDADCEEYNVCLSLLDEWQENFGLEDLIQGLLFLMYNPNLEDPLSPLFDGTCDTEEFLSNVKKSLRGESVEGVIFPKMIDGDGKEDIEAARVIEACRGAEQAADAIESVVSELVNGVLGKVAEEEKGEASGAIGGEADLEDTKQEAVDEGIDVEEEASPVKIKTQAEELREMGDMGPGVDVYEFLDADLVALYDEEKEEECQTKVEEEEDEALKTAEAHTKPEDDIAAEDGLDDRPESEQAELVNNDNEVVNVDENVVDKVSEACDSVNETVSLDTNTDSDSENKMESAANNVGDSVQCAETEDNDAVVVDAAQNEEELGACGGATASANVVANAEVLEITSEELKQMARRLEALVKCAQQGSATANADCDMENPELKDSNCDKDTPTDLCISAPCVQHNDVAAETDEAVTAAEAARVTLREIQAVLNQVLPAVERTRTIMAEATRASHAAQAAIPTTSTTPNDIPSTNTTPITTNENAKDEAEVQADDAKADCEEEEEAAAPAPPKAPLAIPDILEKVEAILKDIEVNGEPADDLGDDSDDSYFTDESYDDEEEDEMDPAEFEDSEDDEDYVRMTPSRLHSLYEQHQQERRWVRAQLAYLVLTLPPTLMATFIDLKTMFKW